MKLLPIALALVLALGGIPGLAHAQEAPPARVLELSFQPDGRVNLSARNVTIREILVEWARQCGCYVVNAEKLPGGPLQVPLLFQHESQERVLESLLRQAAGFVLAPQRQGSLSRSDFETIYILASSNATANSFMPSSTPVSAPLPTAGSPDDELPPVSPMMPQGMPSTAVPPPGAPGGAPMPMAPGQQSPTAIPGTTQQQQPQGPRVPGTPMTFVPIVPIGPAPATPGATAPGTVTPVTPQGR